VKGTQLGGGAGGGIDWVAITPKKGEGHNQEPEKFGAKKGQRGEEDGPGGEEQRRKGTDKVTHQRKMVARKNGMME